MLIVGGLYLTRAPGAPPRTPVPGASPTGRAVAPPVPEACGAAGSCAPSPIHVSLARVPGHARTGRPGGHPSSTGLSPAGSPSQPGRRAPSASASRSGSTQPGPSSGQQPTAQQGAPADQVLALINQARASAGLPPLTVTAGLEASASAHNLRMADGCGLTHQCPGEPAIGARETAAGVTGTAAGENIGEGGPMPDTTAAMAQMAVTLTQDMLNERPPDDGHRLNILSSAFTHIGIAVYRDSSGTVWLTQDFSN